MAFISRYTLCAVYFLLHAIFEKTSKFSSTSWNYVKCMAHAISFRNIFEMSKLFAYKNKQIGCKSVKMYDIHISDFFQLNLKNMFSNSIYKFILNKVLESETNSNARIWFLQDKLMIMVWYIFLIWKLLLKFNKVWRVTKQWKLFNKFNKLLFFLNFEKCQLTFCMKI